MEECRAETVALYREPGPRNSYSRLILTLMDSCQPARDPQDFQGRYSIVEG
jgi:hypothetical protein